MADETKDTTTTTEVVYESDAMADIKARIAEQKAAIKAANDAVKELRRAGGWSIPRPSATMARTRTPTSSSYAR